MPPAREPGHELLEPRAPPRDVGDRDEHALAAREQVAGHAGEALAAAVDGLGRRPPRPATRVRRLPLQRAPQPLPERAVLAEHAQLARGGSGRARAGSCAARPRRSSGCAPAAARCRGSASAAGASAFGGEPNATPRERAPPAVTSVKRACSLSSPMPATFSKRAAGTSRVGCGLPIPNGRRRSSSSASSSPSSAAGHHGVDALDRDQVRRAPARRRRGRRARARNGSTAPAVQLHAGGHAVAAEAGQVRARRRPGRRAGRTARCCGPSRGRSRPRRARSPRTGGASARPAARPRCRPRPGASPRPPPRSRAWLACGSAGGLGGEQDARLGLPGGRG